MTQSGPGMGSLTGCSRAAGCPSESRSRVYFELLEFWVFLHDFAQFLKVIVAIERGRRWGQPELGERFGVQHGLDFTGIFALWLWHIFKRGGRVGPITTKGHGHGHPFPERRCLGKRCQAGHFNLHAKPRSVGPRPGSILCPISPGASLFRHWQKWWSRGLRPQSIGKLERGVGLAPTRHFQR